MKVHYNWSLSDIPKATNGKVFSCFSCGGGSSMGYKLAGFDVIGVNEIDPRVMKVYKKNFSPQYAYCEAIQSFRLREDLPPELYNLDILDGSPPCSTFSMMGKREKTWGVKKHFREGQEKQVLDTLFFDFIALANKLRPKLVIAENVKGLLMGKAKEYVERIYKDFDHAGYHCQHYLLDAQYMGVPQRRERVFFIALRKDLGELPKLTFPQNNTPILLSEVTDYKGDEITSPVARLLWDNRKLGDRTLAEASIRIRNKYSCFAQRFGYQDKVCPTLTSKNDDIKHFDKPLILSPSEVIKISSFPRDYDFDNLHPRYICGMSVPPLMMYTIITTIEQQILNQLINI